MRWGYEFVFHYSENGKNRQSIVRDAKLDMWHLYHILKLLDPIVYFVGLVVALWGFRKSNKKGYLVISGFFVLGLFSILAMPTINKAQKQRSSKTLPPGKLEAMIRELNAVHERYYPPGKAPVVNIINVNFSLGSSFVVAGVWMLARKEEEPESRPPENSA